MDVRGAPPNPEKVVDPENLTDAFPTGEEEEVQEVTALEELEVSLRDYFPIKADIRNFISDSFQANLTLNNVSMNQIHKCLPGLADGLLPFCLLTTGIFFSHWTTEYQLGDLCTRLVGSVKMWHKKGPPVSKSQKMHGADLHRPVKAVDFRSHDKEIDDPPTVSRGQRDRMAGNLVSSFFSSAAEYTSQLATHFIEERNRNDAERLVAEAKREMEIAHANSSLLPDLSGFLTPVAVWELKHIRKLSHLCGLTYKPGRVTPRGLKKMHSLDLVASSWAYPFKPFDPLSTAEDIEAEGDGMGAAVRDIQASASTSSSGEPWEQKQQQPGSDSMPSVVSRRLAEAASAAAGPLASAAGSIYAGFQSLPLPFSVPPTSGSNNSPPSSSTSPITPSSGAYTSTGSSVSQTAKLASALAGVAQAGGAHISSTLSNALGSNPLPVPSTSSFPLPSSSSLIPASSSGLVSSACPSHWFVVDDTVHHLRTFVIQGSDTIDHWRLNLTFDPISFEDPALGVTVHRGVYEAARALYSSFLPLVKDHLASSPLARVTFTGHSIGGSIATLLLFMYRHRGVLDTKHISTVYTFGAPTVFCEGPDGSPLDDSSYFSSSSNEYSLPRLSSSASEAAVTSFDLVGAKPGPLLSQSRAHEGGPSRLMSTLGLQERVIRNCIMHRDIVPRAFACDYSLVAEILKGWGQGFAMHCSLGGDGRKHLYYYVGRLIVLQPDSWNSFVGEGDDHPLLSPGPGLYYLSDPEAGAVPKSPNQSVPAKAGAAPVPANAHEAVMELMDNPHPLETLADPKAYLPFGSISRYHNPDNYTQAFGRVLHLTRQVERGGSVRVANRSFARSGGRPVLSPLSSSIDTYKRLAADMMDLRSDGNEPWLWDSSDEDEQVAIPAPINFDPIGSYHS